LSARCVILVPANGPIEPGCEDALRELEKRGYPVRRVRGYSQVDVARNQMAADAVADGFDELMWVDSDVVFNPDDVDRLRGHTEPFVCGLYAKKGRREFACAFLPGTETLKFGRDGALHEILYAGFGFVLTRREVFERTHTELELPVCNARFGRGLVPWFQPLAVPDAGGHWYLGEDYAFCERARRCGFRVMADTAVRLWHVGSYRYGWEEAGADPARFDDYAYHLRPPTDR